MSIDNQNTINTIEPPPTTYELACIDLLAKQENVIDQLVQPDERADDVGMLSGALEILEAFMCFADTYSDDLEAIALAESVKDLAIRIGDLKQQLVDQSSWFGGRTPELSLSHTYDDLGNSIASLCASQFSQHLKRCRQGSNYQRLFRESSESFLREFMARW